MKLFFCFFGSCAGVCSYEGRGGLCSIRLSQPILKLRPRKNLVETLLVSLIVYQLKVMILYFIPQHEMIHAYLFVTDNNKVSGNNSIHEDVFNFCCLFICFRIMMGMGQSFLHTCIVSIRHRVPKYR